MFASFFALGVFIVLLATRSRLDRTEKKLREQSEQLAKQATQLDDQTQRIARLEHGLDAARGVERLQPLAAESGDGFGPSGAQRGLPATTGAETHASTVAFRSHEQQHDAEAGGVGSYDGTRGSPLPMAAGDQASGAAEAGGHFGADGVGGRAGEAGSRSGAGAIWRPARGHVGAGSADTMLRREGGPAAVAAGEPSGTSSSQLIAAGGSFESGAAGGAASTGAGGDGYRPPDWQVAALAAVRELLFGGNTLVRAGIVVLLVGVVLLLRWAAEHSLFPVELRLGSVAAVAIGLVVLGVRERTRRPGFAMTVQGGGIAALYLVVFFAYRSYELLPPSLAFGLLCAVAICGGVLSVQQDSQSLSFIALTFAFAAPLLAASDHGSHVALFSYYLVLNLLVFAVALFKAWRVLNLLGFVFTFGIASLWGVLRYEPKLFAETEPFLITFFALYVAIPVLFALRHPSVRGGWVDGSLVFGVPLSTLALQWSLIHDRPFGMAFSVLALAGVYLGLVLLLRRRAPERLAVIADAFLPIGIGFATLAIPYALDDHHLTSAAWGLEGAGLYWVGVRQRRVLSRAAGVALCLLAGGAASLDPQRAASALPVLNSWFLASALTGTSSLFVACHAYVQRSELGPREVRGLQLSMLWGLGFWLRAGFGELDAWLPPSASPGGQLAFLALLALGLETAARRADWTPGRVPGLLLWLAMAGFLAQYAWQLELPPLARWGLLAWPLTAATMLVLLRWFVDARPAFTLAHAAALWLWAWWCMLLCERSVALYAALPASYAEGAAISSCALLGLGVLSQSRSERWPMARQRAHYLTVAMTGLMLLGAARAAHAQLALSGDRGPLPYLPLLNPLDLSALIGVSVCLLWLRRVREVVPSASAAGLSKYGPACVGALLFGWWNAQLARNVSHYAGVDFTAEALFRSSELQLAYSLSWTAIALGVMWIAHRRGARTPWITAACLLAVVLLKLFLLDLSRLSTPAKIVSFLGVGALLLSVGYIAPVPPRRAAERRSTNPVGARP